MNDVRISCFSRRTTRLEAEKVEKEFRTNANCVFGFRGINGSGWGGGLLWKYDLNVSKQRERSKKKSTWKKQGCLTANEHKERETTSC